MAKIGTLALTKSEADIASWALDAMNSLGGDDEYADMGYAASDVPVLGDDGVFAFNGNADAMEDLLYRIEEQLPSMSSGASDGEWPRVMRDLKAAKSLARKLRETFLDRE